MNNDAGYQSRKITENDDTLLLPPMPLQTIKDFDELETLLSEEPQARRQLVYDLFVFIYNYYRYYVVYFRCDNKFEIV